MPKYADGLYDSLFQRYAAKYALPWRLIKAQAWQESNFNPKAVSSCGAKGLMQLMPRTDFEIDGDMDAFDPEGNVDNGVRYDKIQFDHFPEIPDVCEKFKFMLAAYNGGRGNVNKALEHARIRETGTAVLSGSGFWQTWAFTKREFQNLPVDHKQIVNYVDRIWALFMEDVLFQ